MIHPDEKVMQEFATIDGPNYKYTYATQWYAILSIHCIKCWHGIPSTQDSIYDMT